jgi:hypothetical protein
MTQTTDAIGRLKLALDSLHMHELRGKGHIYCRFLINEAFRGREIFFRRSATSWSLI